MRFLILKYKVYYQFFSRILFFYFLRSFVGDPVQYKMTDSVEKVVRKVFELYINSFKLFTLGSI